VIDDTELLSLAITLAERAGAEIRAVRARGFQIERKADQSMVTEADRAAEAVILAGLRQALPGCVVVAEEETAAGPAVADPALPGPAAPGSGAPGPGISNTATSASPSGPAAEFWLVDPLDGTREFTGGGDDFAVNIGLVRARKPVLGVVGVPASGEVFSGIVGIGAWHQKGAHRTQIFARLPPREGLTVVASRHHGDPASLDAFLAGRTVARLVNFGSSLKFCRLAQGEADLYPRFGRTMEWDTCAPQAVLEAAGGTVETLTGGRLHYGKPGWDNPHFVCWGRRPA